MNTLDALYTIKYNPFKYWRIFGYFLYESYRGKIEYTTCSITYTLIYTPSL